jgi:hypothetical protein
MLPHDNQLSTAITRPESDGRMLEDFVLKSPSSPFAAEVADKVTIEPL